MSYFVAINRFNNYMVDLGISFHILILQMFHLFDKVPDISEFGSVILRGPMSRTVLLDLAIFRYVDKIRDRLRKYMRHSMTHDHNSHQFESDDESPNSNQRRLEHMSQIQKQQEKQEREQKQQEKLSMAIEDRIYELKYSLLKYQIENFDNWTDDMIKEFQSDFEEFVSLLPDRVLSVNRTPPREYIKQWFQEKHDMDLKSYIEKIYEREKKIEQLEHEINVWSKISSVNPDAPPMSEFSFNSKTLLDDIEFNRELIQENQQDIRRQKKNMDEWLREKIPIEKEVDIFLSIVEKVKRTSKKHRRDSEDADDHKISRMS